MYENKKIRRPNPSIWLKAFKRIQLTNARGHMILPKHRYPTTTNCGYPNTTETQVNDVKSNLIKMAKAFKEEMNTSIKEIQENVIKHIEILMKKQINPLRTYRKIQTGEGIRKPVQDLKVEIEATKKTQTEEILEMENLGK